MSERGGYGQFCPVSMAAEVLCTRWTVLVIRELLCGSTRFNDLRRGVPRMSPALLSKRLKDLEKAGIVATVPDSRGNVEYHLTAAGEDLRPLVMGIGFWGQRWVESQLSLRNLDPSLLMWDMRRNLRPEPLPPRRCTVQFLYPELPAAQRNFWLVIENGTVDLCSSDPGFEVDLLVTSSLRTMTAVWMGLSVLRREIETGSLRLDGDPALARSMQHWLGLSPFAVEQPRLAAAAR
jgi:DNA-binding HxlR family transcriptional regulator